MELAEACAAEGQQAIQRVGGDAGDDIGRYIIEDFGGEPTGLAHGREFIRAVDFDAAFHKLIAIHGILDRFRGRLLPFGFVQCVYFPNLRVGTDGALGRFPASLSILYVPSL